jgi:hypothetical protein
LPFSLCAVKQFDKIRQFRLSCIHEGSEPASDKLFACRVGHGTCINAYGKAQMCMELRDPKQCIICGTRP